MKLTQEQVIAWAREAGLPRLEETDEIFCLPSAISLANLAYDAGRKDENEACAKVCEAQRNVIIKQHPARIEFDPNDFMASKCAALIRLRGNHD